MSEPRSRRPRRRWARWRSLLPLLAVAAAAAFVLLLTLTPGEGGSAPQSLPRLTLIAGRRGGADVLANVALFLPLGVALAAARLRLWQALLVGALLSLSVETAQFWIPGRVSALGDVVMNTAGTGAGWLLLRAAAARGRRARTPAALAFALLLSALPPAAVAATGWLLAPEVQEGEYRVRWAPARRGMDGYGGSVAAVRIGEAPLPEGTPGDAAALIRAWLEAGEPLAIEGTAGAPTARPAFLLRAIVRWGEPLRARVALSVAAHGEDALLFVARRARGYRLYEPYLRLENAFAPFAPGEPLALEAWREGRGWRVRVGEGAPRRLAFGPADGWMLLVTSMRLDAGTRGALGVAWALLLALPAGVAAPRRAGAALLHAACVAAALGLALLLPGTLVLRAWEAGVLVAGYLAGVALARALRAQRWPATRSRARAARTPRAGSPAPAPRSSS